MINFTEKFQKILSLLFFPEKLQKKSLSKIRINIISLLLCINANTAGVRFDIGYLATI